jgi:hypothetical protein
VEQQRRARIGLELVGLAAAVVREEGYAAIVDALAEHHPRRRAAVRGGGGQRDRVRLRDAVRARLVEPAAKQHDRVLIEVALGEGPVGDSAHGAAA